MQETKLYRKNSLGIGTWRVYLMPGHTQTRATIVIAHATVEGGSEVTHTDEVHTNQSGRNIMQQVELEMKSRISRQLDKGYKRTREEALLGSTNQLGLLNPMLAQKIQDVRITQTMLNDAYVQPKFDGHRCLITKQNGDMLAYSRKGKPIETIPHLLEDAYNWMQDGDTLDGELYVHGRKLQDLSSDIKRTQASSAGLCYYWYDIADQKQVFSKRYALMKDLYVNSRCPQIILTPTVKVTKMAEVYSHFAACRAEGYEGSMLRLSLLGYQDAKRSDQLIKVKERHDGEVKVIGCRPSAQGWAILRVEFDDGGKALPVQFDISAPGSVPEKTEVLQNFDAKYMGKQLTIEYAMLTNEGIPFHAVATRWREDV